MERNKKKPVDSIPTIARWLRSQAIIATTAAGSGHPTSCLSAADIAATLCFGGTFRFDVKRPHNPANDRLIFSKGHAAPLFYALFSATGGLPSNQLRNLRKFSSNLEGHPSMRFPFTEAPTGSLGQGLSVGLGMALAAKYIERSPARIYVLLGDSEMAEGQVWEAMQLAAHYKLSNLVAMIDVNRLGQRGATMLGHSTNQYAKRIASFGWNVAVIDGHDITSIGRALQKSKQSTKPFAIIAKTIKGKGISFLENRNGWHGKALSPDQCEKALAELGTVPHSIRASFGKPISYSATKKKLSRAERPTYEKGAQVATREAYGDAVSFLSQSRLDVIVLDAEVSNSTYAEKARMAAPRAFFEMFIAEQNMASTALGFARRGFVPFASSFAAFLSRCSDQIRMAQYAHSHLVFCGSHAGVSIGSDGPSQMGLDDIAMFRSFFESIVLYPSDAVSCAKVTERAYAAPGIVYLRTTRAITPVLYKNSESFPIGGSKTLRTSPKDSVTLVGCGITLHECLKAHDILLRSGVHSRVIDLYSIKPLDQKTLRNAAKKTNALIVVEDHASEGGVAEAVRSGLEKTACRISSLSVRKIPRSGTPSELLSLENIDAQSIVQTAMKLIKH